MFISLLQRGWAWFRADLKKMTAGSAPYPTVPDEWQEGLQQVEQQDAMKQLVEQARDLTKSR